MAISRTNLSLVLVFVSVFVEILSESDIIKLNYDMDDIKTVDLLRGTGQHNEEIRDVQDIKNIDFDKSISEFENLDYEDKDANPQSGLKNGDRESKTTTEDEYLSTTEVNPEALGLKNNGDTKQDSDAEEKINNNDSLTDATPIEEIADTTLSMIDNNVYKSRDNNPEDIYSVGHFNNAAVSKTEPPILTTTKAMDEMEDVLPRIAELEDELDTVGQRNPKTENSETKPSIDKRNYDQPRSSPAVSKSTTLRSWLEDTWLRPPAGILVPLRPMALNRALGVWNDLIAGGLNLSDIVIVGYDSNGVNWRSRHNLQPTNSGNGDRAVSEALSKLLLKYQGVNTEDNASDGTMRALATAAKLVPYDSALFVVTDKGAGDPQRLPLALRALVEKRLKVYTIWTDPDHSTPESEIELQQLKNISQHTEGDFLHYALQVMEMDGSSNIASGDLQQWDPVEMLQGRQARLNSQMDTEKLETLLVRRGGGEAISLGMPVESGVTALRIYIEGAVDHAVLYPPNEGPQIDLYNASSVSAFSRASRSEGQSPRDVYLVFPGMSSDIDMLSVLPASQSNLGPISTMVGVWHLSVRCDTCDYRLCVGARAQLHFDVDTDIPGMLKLRVSGPVASVRETTLVDEYGTELAKLPFSYQPMTTDGHEEKENPMSEVVTEVDFPAVKGSKIYVKIVGRDIRGESFVRLSGPLDQQSEIRTGRSASIVFPESDNDLEIAEEENSRIYNAKLQYNDSNVLPNNRAVSQIVNQRGSFLTTVQIGLSSKLYGAPEDNLQLHFEVTNYREQAIPFRFGARGELNFLRGINPAAQTIQSGQTVNVIVSLRINPTAQPGARDLITFTAYGLEQVSISAYVYVINTGMTTSDVWAPELRHNFQGTCIGRQGTDCAQHVWSATITARDANGGLLRLTSSPIGLVYDSNFIAGTREQVTATYRATCCAPRVMVSAVDAYGNTNSYVIDISNYFTGAAIAAIVLGVILVIALIALIIFLIYWCVKRRKESRELSSYNTRNMS